MTTSPKARQIIVRSASSSSATGWLEYGPLRFPCALGKSGTTVQKREGDAASPQGTWRVEQLYYRADRMVRPKSGLTVRPIRRTDGWCDTPFDRNYNRPITHPYPQSAEHLWRDDNIYDLLVTLNHNTLPRCHGRGSAIFIHIARPGYSPTEGCIAVKFDHLKRLLALMRPGKRVKIGR